MSSRRPWLLATVAVAGVNACALAPLASPTPIAPTATPGPTLVASPTPVATLTFVATPTLTASPSAAPTPSEVAPPTASPAPSAVPSPVRLDARWDVERVTDRYAREVSLAIDHAGVAHVVATTKQGIGYWTNESGTWAREPIGSPADGADLDRSPVIAIGEGGEVVVAYERSACFPLGCGGAQVFVTIRTSTGWSSPGLVAEGVAPSLATMDGVIGVAYTAIGGFSDVACEEPSPIDYAVLSDGDWLVERIADDGERPLLAYGPGATPHVVLGNLCRSLGESGLYLAVPGDPGSSFALEPIPGTSPDNNSAYAVAVDDTARTHLLYVGWDDEGENALSLYTVRDAAGWATPFEPLPGRSARWMAADGAGQVHVVGQDGEGTWHATNQSGAFTFDQVTADLAGLFEAAVALDGAGRPHVLYGTGYSKGASLAIWYGVLTAP